jgi:hypothetical protein
MTREDVDRMKHAINQYHIQNRKDYSENRRVVIDQEVAKRKEAMVLVKQLKQERDIRMIKERQRIKKMIRQQQEAYLDANRSLPSIRKEAARY